MIYVGNIYAGLSGGGGGGTVTGADNGLSLSGTIVQLGGPLIQSTEVFLSGFAISIGGFNNGLTIDDTANLAALVAGDGANDSTLTLNGIESILNVTDGTNNSVVDQHPDSLLIAVNTVGSNSQIDMGGGSMLLEVFEGANRFIQITGSAPTKFADNIAGLWSVYDADYSGASDANPRSIPDVGWVLSEIGSNSPVASDKVAGSSTTATLITYAVPSTATQFLVTGSVNYRSGTGLVLLTVNWTDTGGNAGTVNLQSISSVGPGSGGIPATIYANVGTNITVVVTISAGTAIVDIATAIQFIN